MAASPEEGHRDEPPTGFQVCGRLPPGADYDCYQDEADQLGAFGQTSSGADQCGQRGDDRGNGVSRLPGSPHQGGNQSEHRGTPQPGDRWQAKELITLLGNHFREPLGENERSRREGHPRIGSAEPPVGEHVCARLQVPPGIGIADRSNPELERRSHSEDGQ